VCGVNWIYFAQSSDCYGYFINQSCGFLRCCAMWFGGWKPTFRRQYCLHFQGLKCVVKEV